MKKPANIKFKVYCTAYGEDKQSMLITPRDIEDCIRRICYWIEDNCAHPDHMSISLFDDKREICTYFWDKTDAQPDFWDAWHDVESAVEAVYANARAKKWWKVF